MPARPALVDDHGVQQALAAHELDHRVVEIAETLAEKMAEALGPLHEVLVAHDFEGADGDGAAQRVAPVGGAVRAGFDAEHDLLGAQHGGDRVHASRDGFSQQDEVGFDARPVVAEEFAGAGDARLDLVADQEHVVFVAEGAHLAEVVVGGDDDAGFALDGLDEESGDVLTVGFEGGT